MITERSLKALSHKVYKIDSKHYGYSPLKIGEIEEIDGVEYRIIKVEDNTTNGMQAMAVAPVKNEKVDTSEVVIAFPGINLYSLLST